MKMKIIIITIVFLIVLILSYIKMSKTEINYTIMGDKDLFSNNIKSRNFSDLIYDELKEEKDFGFYSEEFIKSDARIVDIMDQIKVNEEIKGVRVQNILKRTKILLINIGNNELYYKLSKVDSDISKKEIYSYIDDVYEDLKKLIEEIRKYNDNNIILLGFYNNTGNKSNDKYYEYINKKVSNYSINNGITFINLFNILNKNDDYLANLYVTNEGNMALFNKIYSKISDLYLHKVY